MMTDATDNSLHPHPRPCEYPDVTCRCARPYIASDEAIERARSRMRIAAFFIGVRWFRVAKNAGAF
jgi:hypothetical protein